jgi:glycosyltransferase involved in cell wall biosynthesis
VNVNSRICLYGDVNLNLIDGSAIWLAALAETLALDPECQVTVVLKSPIERPLVVAPLLERPNVELVTHPDAPERLTPAQALDVIEQRDATSRFDVVLLRGFSLCTQAAERAQLHGRLWTYLTDIPQQPWLATEDDRVALTAIAEASQRVLCQTDELRAYLEGLIPATARRTALLTPMVPEGFVRPARDRARPPKLFYAGKFAPMWGFLETVAAFTQLRAAHPDLELHVAGDKIHNPPEDPDYAPAVRTALADTPGLVWHGAVTREDVAELLVGCDIALSARHPTMDDSLELSTKILEYGAANVPVVLNRNTMHERLFGGDYPLFVDHLDDLAAVVERTLADDGAWESARDTAHAVALGFTLPKVRERLVPLLRAAHPQGRGTLRRRRVVVAGHDLKFSVALSDVLRRAGAEVRQDPWNGHTGHDQKHSRELLDWADTLWAEWCLGNAVWYAEHRRDDQRLITRLHLQELTTDFPGLLDPQRVDQLVCVAPFMAEQFLAQYGWPEDRVSVVPNTFDMVPFDRPKLPGAEFTIGMIGTLPSRKRLDLAVELLDRLLDHDPRWQLRIAGSMPWDTPWAWARLKEREFYVRLLDRIRTDRRLARAVRFEGPVANIPGWFAGIGVIASVSDFESFHLALAEGLASRSVPIVVEREGVHEIFPGIPVHADIGAAAEWLAELTATERAEVVSSGQALVHDRYDLTTVGERWVELLLG